jgi:hypothetical protein
VGVAAVIGQTVQLLAEQQRAQTEAKGSSALLNIFRIIK